MIVRVVTLSERVFRLKGFLEFGYFLVFFPKKLLNLRYLNLGVC